MKRRDLSPTVWVVLMDDTSAIAAVAPVRRGVLFSPRGAFEIRALVTYYSAFCRSKFTENLVPEPYCFRTWPALTLDNRMGLFPIILSDWYVIRRKLLGILAHPGNTTESPDDEGPVGAPEDTTDTARE